MFFFENRCISALFLLSYYLYDFEKNGRLNGMKRILYLDRPAENWETTSPLGNGLMGVILFGGTENEKIYLNE